LITSGFLSPVAAPFDPLAASALGVVGLELLSGIASLAGVSRSVVDLEGTSDILRMSVPGVGADAKSLYELSVIRGIFHGNLRNDMQQKIIARDQISAG
jgi:hypothetical protein